MKTFTDSEKWDDKWFRALLPDTKLIYIYILDRSDHAGVWDLDGDALRFQTKLDLDDVSILHHLGLMDDKIQLLPCGKYWLVNYITFQQPKGLSRKFKHCAPIFRSLEKHGIDPDQFQQSVMDLDTEGEVASDDDINCTTVIDLWNTTCSDLPKINKLTASRKRFIKSASKEKISFFDLFNKVAESDFLMGRSSKWKANFDFVIKPENRIKIMEGNYVTANRSSHSTDEHAKGF